jgi:hypothetical protein
MDSNRRRRKWRGLFGLDFRFDLSLHLNIFKLDAGFDFLKKKKFEMLFKQLHNGRKSGNLDKYNNIF